MHGEQANANEEYWRAICMQCSHLSPINSLSTNVYKVRERDVNIMAEVYGRELTCRNFLKALKIWSPSVAGGPAPSNSRKWQKFVVWWCCSFTATSASLSSGRLFLMPIGNSLFCLWYICFWQTGIIITKISVKLM